MCKLSWWGIALILSALILGACSSTQAQSAEDQVVVEMPEEVGAARDAALAYLAEHYGGEAPAAGLAWTEKHTKPAGLVGGESYTYTAGDWVIGVSYPVVAPENVIYTIQVNNQATGFRWEGQVDPAGQVTEQSAPAGEGADMVNPASAYCEQQGYRLEIVTAADGSQSGVCVFPDGSSCDEWAHFRGECGPGGTAATPEIASDGSKIARATSRSTWVSRSVSFAGLSGARTSRTSRAATPKPSPTSVLPLPVGSNGVRLNAALLAAAVRFDGDFRQTSNGRFVNLR